MWITILSKYLIFGNIRLLFWEGWINFTFTDKKNIKFALNIFLTDWIFFWLNQNLKDKLLRQFDFLFFEIEKDALWWSSKILSLPLKVFCYIFAVNLEVDPVAEVSLFDTFFYSAFFIKFVNTSTNKIVS